MTHERFSYKNISEIEQKAKELNVKIPLSDDFSVLAEPYTIGKLTFQNRVAIQPMEGCDGTSEGTPDELTKRRYRRFARSGAALIWAEAVAVVPEGRANPRQLMITEKNLDEYKKMVEDIRQISMRETGVNPVIALQLTHSGRYSKPEGTPRPLIGRNNPIFEKDKPLSRECIVTDDYISSLPEKYAKSAFLAEQAGFDIADIKACHGYLINEILAGHIRPGQYGGSFENRTKLILDAVRAVKSSTNITAATRINLYDGFPKPYGWGVDSEGNFDAAAPVKLIKMLRKAGVELADYTMGNPYVNPHVNRPYDSGFYTPPEHPLEGIDRMAAYIGEIKKQCPEMPAVGSGYTYLRQFSINFAAGTIKNNMADFAGFGRMAFAYPEFYNDFIKAEFDPGKCCIACGKCSELMRAGCVAGCVIRDKEVYFPIYKKGVLTK